MDSAAADSGTLSVARSAFVSDERLQRSSLRRSPASWRDPMMKTNSFSLFVVVFAFALVAGRASAQQHGEMETRQRVIEQITQMQIPTNHYRGVGAIVGGLSGLGIGGLIGLGLQRRRRSGRSAVDVRLMEAGGMGMLRIPATCVACIALLVTGCATYPVNAPISRVD